MHNLQKYVVGHHFTKLQTAIGMLCIFLLLSGCGGNGVKSQTKDFPNDGLLGTTYANPNDPSNPTYHNYRADSNLIKQAIPLRKEIQSSSIAFNGPTILVTLTLDADTDAQTVKQIRQETRMSVSNNMPRYKVQVKVKMNNK